MNLFAYFAMDLRERKSIAIRADTRPAPAKFTKPKGKRTADCRPYANVQYKFVLFIKMFCGAKLPKLLIATC
jgi:hypothetical protein